MRARLAILGLVVAICVTAAPAPAAASLTPNQIHAAYSLPRTGAAGQTIAIVSAYDDPGVQADLNAYTRRFGIPACTVANGCFRVLNQSGARSPLPPRDTGGQFITESSIGVEVARGVCQSCSIMLVEASSFAPGDLSAAAATAARAGAGAVVTTFNIGDDPADAQYAPDFTHPGSVVVAAAGDGGYDGAPTFPASLPGVLAVGGTRLRLTPQGGYRGESAWAQTTSGCSLFERAASWQAALAASAGCGSGRAVADLAAVASPGPLVHIQDLGSPCGPSWCEAEGTSVSAPIIAGVIGLAGSGGSSEVKRLYTHARRDPGAFHDVTSGTTHACGGQPICSARRGYDGPTGLGTPYGLAAFLAGGGAIDRRHPRLSLSAPRNRLSVDRRWTTRLTVHNGNAFAVRGTVALARRLRVGRRLRRVTFASTSFGLGPLAGRSMRIVISKRERGLLKRLGDVRVTTTVTVRGPAGRPATATRSMGLFAP